jgi:hypothetical protein
MNSEPMSRLTSGFGSDEANLENHSFKVRPDGAFIVPKHIADILTSDGHSGFTEHADDERTLSEIKLLASVLQDQTMRTSILAAITSRKLLALQ